MSTLSRTTLYCCLSTVVTVAVIVNAFEARPNFFAAAMYLSQSSACLMVLTNMFLVFTLISGKILQNVFFGRLRAIEIDHLYERAWYAVTESCLAMTIFREEFNTRFFLFFTLLLSVKIFHWLAQDRIEYMEQTAEVARSFHVRMTSIITLLLTIDIYMVSYCMDKVLVSGPNVMIMFAFEFTILAATILAVAGKYCLNLIEARHSETWDNKSAYIFYLELLTDFIKLITYVAFFATIMTFYGIPLHIVRDLYVTLRSFTTKCRNFMRFRKATQDMDARYPNATLAELEATGDKTCIVCREDMLHADEPVPTGDPPHNALDNPKRLPCGHILHFRCLRSWLERQQSCPMCRRPVLDDQSRTPTNNTQAQPRHLPTDVQNQARQPVQGDNNPNTRPTIPSSSTANNTQFQLPTSQGSDPIQLPRGFQLPPGWALLPVSTPPAQSFPTNQSRAAIDNPHNTTAGVTSSDVPSAARSGTMHNTRQARNDRLPPIIPLFNSGNQATAQTISLPPELSDEQVAAMESSTRRTVEERLRILSEIEVRVQEGMSMLTRLQANPTLTREAPRDFHHSFQAPSPQDGLPTPSQAPVPARALADSTDESTAISTAENSSITGLAEDTEDAPGEGETSGGVAPEMPSDEQEIPVSRL